MPDVIINGLIEGGSIIEYIGTFVILTLFSNMSAVIFSWLEVTLTIKYICIIHAIFLTLSINYTNILIL